MNNAVTIDSTQVDRLLDALDDPEVKNKILFDGIVAGAKVLQQTTKNYFRQKVGEAATHYSRYIQKPFEDGIIVKTDKAYCEAKVSLMGEHRIKWFEKGTNPRYTKGRKITGYTTRHRAVREGKGHYTGQMTPKYFFKDARQDTNAIDDAIAESINNALSNLDK
jgi:hypothetical protein